jgi:hypothetical protein
MKMKPLSRQFREDKMLKLHKFYALLHSACDLGEGNSIHHVIGNIPALLRCHAAALRQCRRNTHPQTSAADQAAAALADIISRSML